MQIATIIVCDRQQKLPQIEEDDDEATLSLANGHDLDPVQTEEIDSVGDIAPIKNRID